MPYAAVMKIAAYAAICLIWGTTWLAIRIGLHGLAPLTAAGTRFVIAAVILYAVAWFTGRLRPMRTLPWRLIGVLAIFSFVLDYGLIYIAETQIDSGLVAVLFSAMPFFTMVISYFMLGERTTMRALIGAAIAFAGICVVSLTQSIHAAPAALFVIAAAACASFSNVYAKRHYVEPLVSLPPAMLLGGAIMLAAGLAHEPLHWNEALSLRSIGALLYLAVAGSAIAFFLMLWLIERLPALTVSMSTLIIPIVALIVGVVFGGEHVDARIILGSLLVLVGLAAALLPQKERRRCAAKAQSWTRRPITENSFSGE